MWGVDGRLERVGHVVACPQIVVGRSLVWRSLSCGLVRRSLFCGLVGRSLISLVRCCLICVFVGRSLVCYRFVVKSGVVVVKTSITAVEIIVDPDMVMVIVVGRFLRSLVVIVIIVAVKIVVIVRDTAVVVVVRTVGIVIRNRSWSRVRVIKGMGAVSKEVGDFIVVKGIVVGRGETIWRRGGGWYVVEIILGIVNRLVWSPLDDKARRL